METQARIERKSLALKRSVAEKDLEKRALRAASAASANGDYAAARIARREANSHKVSAAQARSEARELRPHHWTALVQPCAACGDYAARWRCPPCEESYCAGCYSQLHAFGSRLTHACDRLGYYTAEIHARDERLFRANTRRVLERHRREAARAAEPTKRNRAAITIQRTYFATVGRVEGQRQLQESRHGQREAWQQLKNGASRHLDMGHLFLDLIGCAPFLSSDAKEQLAVKRVALWKHKSSDEIFLVKSSSGIRHEDFSARVYLLFDYRRARARYFISQNGADICWRANDAADPKKCPARGFDVALLTELCDQAIYGGVRLPGRAFPLAGQKSVAVSHDLSGLVRQNDRIRIGKRLCRIHAARPDAVAKESLQLRFCWLGENYSRELAGEGGGLCLYRLPPQARAGKFWTMLGRTSYENQLTQGVIKRYRGLHVGIGHQQKILAKRLRPWLPKIAEKIKKWSKDHDLMQERIKWWTWDWQVLLEARQKKADREAVRQGMSMEAREAMRDEERKNAYMGLAPKSETMWKQIEVDGKPVWKHVKTGEITAEKPKELKSASELAHEEAKAKMKKKRRY